MNEVNRIKELTSDLLQYCHAYYDLDKPIITDYAYDKLYDELLALENNTGFYLSNSPTRKVQGCVLDGFTKVTHSKPMLSAAKTKDVNEIKRFIKKNDFYCSYKLDGLTMIAVYENGKFKQAITRGTGFVGEDVTEQAKMISNLPMSINYKDRLEIRGECVISWKQFHKVNETLNEPYSHPRNLAAGSLRQLETNITRERGLSYVVFECVSDLYDEDVLFDSKWDELAYLDYIGFETVGRGVGEVYDCVEGMQPDWYEYPVDGLIFEICSKSYSKSLPATNHHEGCRMALKWADSMYKTVLRDIEWNTTRSGLISPVAIFDEIDLDGALTTRATLHNVSIIEGLELGVGDTIEVYRSNMVIPKINDNLTRSNTYEIPNQCPCCGHKAIVKETDGSKVLICTNPHCPAKHLAQFTHFVSRNCMNIQGMSESILSTFIQQGFLHQFSDLYHVGVIRSKLIKLPGFGPKSIDNMLESIEKSRSVRLENFINALGIPQIGQSAAKIISKNFNGDYDAFYDACKNRYDWTKLQDFGDITALNLDTYLDEYLDDMNGLAKEMNFIIPEKKETNDSLKGIKFCITGTFSRPRNELKEALEARGAKFVSSVSKNLDVLFVGYNAGSKLSKAQSLGVRVVDEAELMKMIGE